MKMREAVERTLALHQKVVDGEYRDYIEARDEESEDGCYLCVAVDGNCTRCPWVFVEGFDCLGPSQDYLDSPQSIIRLKRWLDDPRLPA
jgi:hypothetical protein